MAAHAHPINAALLADLHARTAPAVARTGFLGLVAAAWAWC